MTKPTAEKSVRKWTKPQVESITPVRHTRAGVLLKPGAENVVYRNS